MIRTLCCCSTENRAPPPAVQRLEWQLPASLSALVEEQLAVARALASDVDLQMCMFDWFGKGFIKTCRVSPDSFVQCALQLAYYRVRLLYRSCLFLYLPTVTTLTLLCTSGYCGTMPTIDYSIRSIAGERALLSHV